MGKFRKVDVDLGTMPGIFISGKKDAENPQLIKDNNIKVVVEVSDKTSFKKIPGTARFHIWMSDPQKTIAPENPLYEAADVCRIAYILAHKRDGNILIHCVHGSNRSSLVAALLIAGMKTLPVEEAVKICGVKDKKPWMQAFGLNW